MHQNTYAVAVELPAQCPFNCSFCRTPQHAEGDVNAVINAIDRQIAKGATYFYFTSNGETGLFEGFAELVKKLLATGIQVGVLCASKISIVKGLSHAEISFNKETLSTVESAVKKATKLDIPFVISLVDDGDEEFHRYAQSTAKKLGASAVLTRALQPEGRSKEYYGVTNLRIIDCNSRLPWQFPIKAYRELNELPNGTQPICINPFGQIVEYLGGKPMLTTA